MDVVAQIGERSQDLYPQLVPAVYDHPNCPDALLNTPIEWDKVTVRYHETYMALASNPRTAPHVLLDIINHVPMAEDVRDAAKLNLPEEMQAMIALAE
jgi:hypothetical protein